jgi:glutaredoxin
MTKVFFMLKPVQLIVYTLESCPHCENLKDFLKKGGYAFSERDMSTAESLTELRINGVFTNEAPVLQKNEDFYTCTDLFPGGMLDSEQIRTIVKGA